MRCPVCKAENTQGAACRRCKADLSLLFALEKQRRRSLAAARQCLIQGDGRAALEHIEDADWLRGDDESQRLLAAAHLLLRDFAAAWQCYRNQQAAKRAGSLPGS